MIELASALTAPIAKLLLKSWLGDTVADMGVGLFQLGLKRLGDRTKARSAQHRAEEIADAVIADLERFFANEHVGKEKLAVAATALGDTIEQNVDAAFLVHQKLNADAIEQELLKARPVDQIYRSADPEHGWYKQLVKALAPRLRAVAPELPRYELERDTAVLEHLAEAADRAKQTLDKLADLKEQGTQIGTTLDEIATREERERAEYEASYRRAVLTALDYVEILGLDIERTRREASLSKAYLSLTTSIGNLGRADYETILDSLPVLGNLLLVEGAAGSGKSTLLRWTSVEAAHHQDKKILSWTENWSTLNHRQIFNWLKYATKSTREQYKLLLEKFALHAVTDHVALNHIFPNFKAKQYRNIITHFFLNKETGYWSKLKWNYDNNFLAASLSPGLWRRKIPFLIRLRHLKGDFPGPEQLPAHLSVALGRPPKSWIAELLGLGNAILLIDGVDEVPEGTLRNGVLNNIKEYIQLYDKCTFIVASRLNAFDKSGLRDLGFVEAEVNELTPEQRVRFIDSWHRALALNLGRSDADPDIMGIGEKLKVALHRQPQIARLATNPLLCAGICALHERNPETLPKNEWDLCGKLTEMLVEQRDRTQGRQKPIRFEEFGPAYQLPYSDKRSILARIAWAMVSQQLSALPRHETLDQVKKALRETKRTKGLTAKAVVAALEARSGVLRSAGGSPASSKRAKRGKNDVANGSTTREAVEFAHNTLKAWLASFHALDENTPRALANQALVSDYVEVIPFAAAAPGHRQYAELLVKQVLEIADKATNPEDRRALLILAMRCDAVAPNLPSALRKQLGALPESLFPPATFDESQQLAVLGDVAVPHLAPRPELSEDAGAACVRCLRLIGTEQARTTIGAWRERPEPKILEELADVFHPLSLPAVLAAAQNSHQWRDLPPSIKEKIVDLDPFKERQDLNVLFLSGTQVADAAPLANLTNLELLDLSGTQVADAAPFANLTKLKRLRLDGTQVADASPLANLTSLESLDLSGTQVADAAPLANLTKLERLRLDGTQVADASPLANLTSLELLDLSGTQVADAAPLANLTSLELLDLSGTQVADASPLANLTSLESLDLYDTQVADAAPLANLTNLQWLVLYGTQVADAAPLAHLANLQVLFLYDTQVADAAPLANLTKLQTLNLSGTQVADAAPLANLTNLQWLVLDGTQVADAAPLANLTNLRTLDLSGTQIADAAPLANLTKLKRLGLNGTQVTQEAIEQLRHELAARGNTSVEISGP